MVKIHENLPETLKITKCTTAPIAKFDHFVKNKLSSVKIIIVSKKCEIHKSSNLHKSKNLLYVLKISEKRSNFFTRILQKIIGASEILLSLAILL